MQQIQATARVLPERDKLSLGIELVKQAGSLQGHSRQRRSTSRGVAGKGLAQGILGSLLIGQQGYWKQ